MSWSVGYYPKVSLLDSQVAARNTDDGVTTVEQLKEQSYENSAKKLREARKVDSAEAEQTKSQDFKELATDVITTTLPTSIYPSGILSLQVHNIIGLELERKNRPRNSDGSGAADVTEEDGETLPNAYCTVIINHKKIFKTRTKPKNAKPFVSSHGLHCGERSVGFWSDPAWGIVQCWRRALRARLAKHFDHNLHPRCACLRGTARMF